MENKLIAKLHSIFHQIKTALLPHRMRLFIETITICLGILFLVFLITSNKQIPTDDLNEGISYIKALEKKDYTQTEQQIKEIKKIERKKALESGNMDVWKQFNDTVILGDSRVVGFEFYKFIEDNRVYADSGATIQKTSEYLEDIKTVNPSSIILSFGLNDIVVGLTPTCEDFISELDNIIKMLHETLPNATVYVNSIIPVMDIAFETSEKWKEVPEWNQKIQVHCEETGIPYIDITETVNEHKNLYDVDGVHMRKDFYKEWAIAIITEVTENE